MTSLLQEAFQAASKLPAPEQDALALWILDELNADRRWEQALGESAAALDCLAEEALAEHRRGDTQELEPDAL